MDRPMVSDRKNATPNYPPPRKNAKGVVISERVEYLKPTQDTSSCVSDKAKKKFVESRSLEDSSGEDSLEYSWAVSDNEVDKGSTIPIHKPVPEISPQNGRESNCNQ